MQGERSPFHSPPVRQSYRCSANKQEKGHQTNKNDKRETKNHQICNVLNHIRIPPAAKCIQSAELINTYNVVKKIGIIQRHPEQAEHSQYRAAVLQGTLP